MFNTELGSKAYQEIFDIVQIFNPLDSLNPNPKEDPKVVTEAKQSISKTREAFINDLSKAVEGWVQTVNKVDSTGHDTRQIDRLLGNWLSNNKFIES